MQKEELRKELQRLISFDNITDSKDLITIYCECFFRIVKNHQADENKSTPHREAKIIMQMMMTKALHLQSATDGLSFMAQDGSYLNQMIDPTIISSLIRNVYETVAMFNLIYINTKTEDEKTILYNLWVHAGLMYRHRFEGIITQQDNLEKLASEKIKMADLIAEIEATKLYQQLSKANQLKIYAELKKKDYKLKFEDNNVISLHWQELAPMMGIKENLFQNAYTYFSLYAHPSNVAVFQYADMFDRDTKDYLGITNFNLRYFFACASIFIADYIKLFPNAINTFNSLDLIHQIVINFNNTIYRGNEYSINDTWKILN